jgi:hypothetical protein
VKCILLSKLFATAGPTSFPIDVPEPLDVSAVTPDLRGSITMAGLFRTACNEP